MKAKSGLLLQHYDVGATILGHDVVGGIFGGFEVALGEDFDLGVSYAEGDEILFGGGGAAVAEAQVVVTGATPIAAALEEEAILGVGFEVGLGGVEFGALGGGDGGLVVGEIHGLEQAADHILGLDHAITAAKVGPGGLVVEVGAEASGVNGAQGAGLADHGLGRIATGLFRAADREDGGGGDYDEEGLADGHLHVGGVVDVKA